MRGKKIPYSSAWRFTNSGLITKDNLIGEISSGSMAIYVTPSEPVHNLTSIQINGAEGLGLGILPDDLKGLIEIKFDVTKLPLENKFRLPISVLGNKLFRPTKLNSNSGITIGNHLEWITNEFSAEPTSEIIVEIKGLP